MKTMSPTTLSLTDPPATQDTSEHHEDTRVAYDKMMTQRQTEHTEMNTKDKANVERARKWLQPKNSRVQIHDADVPLDKMANDVEIISQTNIENHNQEPKRVRFKSDTESPKRYVLNANSVEDNTVSFNENLGVCDTLRLRHLILKDKLLTHDEHFGTRREVYLSQLPYLIVDVYVNGTESASIPFFQAGTVSDTVIFEADLVLPLNDLVTEIKLIVCDENRRAVNMRHELIVETMIHAAQLAVTEQYDREIYEPEYFYIRIKSGNFKTGDVISINSELYTVVGTCTTTIRDVNHIAVTDLVNYEGHNTMILRLDKAFAMETKLQNTSRNPKCTITTA
jgi:hypothetical protein